MLRTFAYMDHQAGRTTDMALDTACARYPLAPLSQRNDPAPFDETQPDVNKAQCSALPAFLCRNENIKHKTLQKRHGLNRPSQPTQSTSEHLHDLRCVHTEPCRLNAVLPPSSGQLLQKKKTLQKGYWHLPMGWGGCCNGTVFDHKKNMECQQ